MRSDILTIGAALRIAENAGKYADVLVEGQWVLGMVDMVEGDSASLIDDSGDQIILRLSSISAVRVRNAKPTEPTVAGAGTGVNLAAAAPLPAGGTALDAVLAQRSAAQPTVDGPSAYVGGRAAARPPE